MNRTLLFLVLGLSLAGNALLGFFALRGASSAVSHVPPPSPAPPSGPTAQAPKKAADTAAALGEKVAQARTPEDLRGIVASLRAAGFPESLIAVVARAMVSENFAARRRTIFDWAATPYWKNTSPTREQMKAMQALDKEQRAALAELGLPRSAMEEAARQRQWGGLPEAKVAAIEKIQQDYNELRQEMFEQMRDGPGRGQTIAAQQKLLEEEMQRDINAVLTPEEKLDYDLRHSSTAGQLRGQLRNVDVNEQEFRTLFAAQQAYDAANPREFGAPATLPQREAGLAAWDDYQAAARGVLGDERYRQMLIGSQFGGRESGTFFTERPAITVDQIQAVARLNRSLSVDLQKEVSAPGLSSDERRARATAVSDRYRAQVIQILGPHYGEQALTNRVLPMLRSTSTSGETREAIRIPGGG